MGIEIALDIAKKKKEVFKNYKKIAKELKEAFKKVLRDENVRLIVFGSVAKKKHSIHSDIDVLVISKNANKFRYGEIIKKVERILGKELIFFEIHLVTPEIFENWYKKFLDYYEEI
ncbi:MAG: nucleotidyltransferase domain-containing protein [Candidatus Aenigmatarchaeota archaeon]